MENTGESVKFGENDFRKSIDIKQPQLTENRLLESHNRLQAFLQISQTMTSTLEQKEIMQLIVDNAASVTGFNTAAIYLLNNINTIKLEATTPALPVDFPENFRIAHLQDHPHIDRVFKSGEPIIIDDTETAVLTPSEREIINLRKLRSNLYLPIVFRGKTIGVLILSSINITYIFPEEEISLLRGFANQAAQIIENIRNFDALKKYTADLETEFTRRRVLMDQSRDGIVIIDEEGNVFESNRKFAEMLGYSPEEIQKLKLYDWEFLHPHQQIIEMMKSVDEMGDFFETKHRRKDGSIFDVEISSNAALFDGKKLIFCVCRDITERKQAEQTRQQLEIARQAIKFKQNFLANMSHEIRTPLTGVLGMIEIMEQTHLDDQQKDFLNTLKISGENLKVIINQVLDYSKIEAGKVSLNPVVFDFRSIFPETENLYKHSLRKGVEFITYCDPELPQFIEADKFRLSQVVNNLVSNAIKFTHEGSVAVKSTLVSSKVIDGQVIIKIEVTDTGIGISPEMHEKLFSPFSQLDNGDIRKYEGTGLGLSICKQLVEKMGGKIGVTSKYEDGSSFWFTFPAIIADAPIDNSGNAINTSPTSKLRILLAEDKIVNQKVISLMLRSMGHSVYIADDGKKALECFEPGKFDLILMDIQMPVLDGVSATKMLREKYQSLPPIVGLSANAFEGDREKYMALGMDEYLTKPVTKNDFDAIVRRILNA